MSDSWTIYSSLLPQIAADIVDRVQARLERIAGDDLIAARDDDAYPPELGVWPVVEVAGAPIPSSQDERAILAEPNRSGVVFEEAALARLARCRSRIDIHQPAGFEDDPTLVTTVELLLRAVGPSVFCKQRGFDLATSESTLRDLAGRTGLQQAINALDGVVDEPEPVADSDDAMTAEAVHRMLAAVAEHPPRRRRVGERLAVASAIVQELAGDLAQHGPRSDEAISKSTGHDIRAVAAARRALAELLEAAEQKR